jgi:hypothetical protein
MLILANYYLVICNCHFVLIYIYIYIERERERERENQTLEFELCLAAPMVCTSYTSFLTALS